MKGMPEGSHRSQGTGLQKSESYQPKVLPRDCWGREMAFRSRKGWHQRLMSAAAMTSCPFKCVVFRKHEFIEWSLKLIMDLTDKPHLFVFLFCFVSIDWLIESVRSRVLGTVRCRRVDRKGGSLRWVSMCRGRNKRLL